MMLVINETNRGSMLSEELFRASRSVRGSSKTWKSYCSGDLAFLLHMRGRLRLDSSGANKATTSSTHKGITSKYRFLKIIGH